MKRKSKIMAILGLCAGLCLQWVSADTIYVDVNNTSGVTDGLSWETAWTTIQDGANDLTNKTPSWGHTILVAEGVYAETITLNHAHTGADGFTNAFVAVDDVLISGSGSGFVVVGSTGSRVDHIRIDGFRLAPPAGASRRGVEVNFSRNFLIENCTVYGTDVGFHAGYNTSGETRGVIRNCIAYGNQQGIWWREGNGNDIVIENCIIVGNGQYGLFSEGYSGATRTIANNCIYANGVNYMRGYNLATYTMYNTEQELNGAAGFANNTVANPGFADIGNDWNFNAFYEGSPALTGGIGGTVQGPNPTPAIVAVSAQTYYVAEGGNDTAAGTSPATAWATLTNAAAIAKAGDTVIVFPGEYSDPVTIWRGGADGHPVIYRAPDEATLTGLVTIDRVSNLTFDGFNLTAGLEIQYAPTNTVMNIQAASSVSGQNVVDVNCAPCSTLAYINVSGLVGGGNGLSLVRAGGSVIRDCEFRGNPASISSYAAVISASPAIVIQRCSFSNAALGLRFNNAFFARILNSSFVGASHLHGLYTLRPIFVTVANCTMHGNATYGFYLYGSGVGDRADLYNNLITGNEYGAYIFNAGNIYSTNSLFYDNGIADFRNFDGATYAAADIDANVAPIGSWSGTLGTDPLYADAVVPDLRLTIYSPAIDYGIPVPDIGPVDLGGDVRLRGGALDLGAYEWQPPSGTIFRAW